MVFLSIKDVVALTERIKTLLENEKLIKKMGIKSRKRVIDEGWTWEGYGRRINNVYNDVICNK
jgi:glycosyltransferase involved in cell wall biosynthesis